MTRVRLQPWLTAMLAGLFALVMVAAPTQQAHALIERAAFAVASAMPDGTIPDICSGHDRRGEGHDQHLFSPACSACLLMSASGLPTPQSTLARVSPALAVDHCIARTASQAQVTWATQRARAPPQASIT